MPTGEFLPLSRAPYPWKHIHLPPFSLFSRRGAHVAPFRVLVFASFTPYIVTFLHCIGHSDASDLTLLRRVFQSLEQMALNLDPCRRQYELCKSLLRVAEAFFESRGKGLDGACPGAPQQQQQQQLDRTLNLSLQNPLVNDCDWNYLQSTLDGWSGQPLNAPAFTLISRIDGHHHLS